MRDIDKKLTQGEMLALQARAQLRVERLERIRTCSHDSTIFHTAGDNWEECRLCGAFRTQWDNGVWRDPGDGPA